MNIARDLSVFSKIWGSMIPFASLTNAMSFTTIIDATLCLELVRFFQSRFYLNKFNPTFNYLLFNLYTEITLYSELQLSLWLNLIYLFAISHKHKQTKWRRSIIRKMTYCLKRRVKCGGKCDKTMAFVWTSQIAAQVIFGPGSKSKIYSFTKTPSANNSTTNYKRFYEGHST